MSDLQAIADRIEIEALRGESSRSDPPLPLARLRARGQLAELRADELCFTPDEAAALLLLRERVDGTTGYY